MAANGRHHDDQADHAKEEIPLKRRAAAKIPEIEATHPPGGAKQLLWGNPHQQSDDADGNAQEEIQESTRKSSLRAEFILAPPPNEQGAADDSLERKDPVHRVGQPPRRKAIAKMRDNLPQREEGHEDRKRPKISFC